mmetsp:Transcript_14851/g.39400  ORF Transcript_14851/g.39400 Transcript_14851/m.39400 type:complete len:208 (-) Transcript_14851:1056-1679(-)
MMCAVLVLPVPGGPAISTAFLLRSLGRACVPAVPASAPCSCTASQPRSHCCSVLICPWFPTRSLEVRGLCLSTHSWLSAGTLGVGLATCMAGLDAAARLGPAAAAAGVRLGASGLGRGGASSFGTRCDVARMRENRPSSSISFVPWRFASWYLLRPQSWPTIRKVVLPLTACVTLPLCFLMRSVAVSRKSESGTPEITNVLPCSASG